MPDSAGFFGTEDADLPKVDRYKRYVLDPHGKGEKSYTRSTTLAKTLEDTYMLSKWQQRNAARGVALRPDLVARAIVTPVDKKGDWEEILSQAETVAAGGSKANLGTAFHQLHDGIETMTDAEYLAVPENLRVTYERYRAELDRLGITELVSEVTVINEQIGTAGKVDGLLRLADGRVVVGDRKSGKASKYPHSVAIQLANYSHANLIEVDGKFVPMAEAYPDLDPSVGIVIEVSFGDADTATVHVYEFDLEAGWYGALLAAKVRRWRNRKDVHLPYQPEFKPVAAFAAQAVTDRVEQAEERAFVKSDAETVRIMAAGGPLPQGFTAGPVEGETFNLDPNNVAHQQWGFSANQVVAGEHVGLADKLKAEPEISGAGVPFPEAPAEDTGPPLLSWQPGSAEHNKITADRNEADVAALLAKYKTKAEMQTVLRKVNGPNAKVARTRANLAADAVASVNWPQYRSELLEKHLATKASTPLILPQEAPSESYAATHPGVDALPDAEPLEPIIHSDPERGPDYVEVPNSNPFAQPAPVDPPHAPKTHDEILIDMVVAAESDEDLGGVWEYAQKHGMVWTPRVHQAGVLRQAALNS